jgi:asparagine synthetase A
MLDGKAVKKLAIAHALTGATVLGQPGGFAVLVKYGAVERAVAAQRSGRMRIWRNLNTAAAYVRDELGLVRFEIDMTAHDLAAIERKRPDTAARQRQLHAADEHGAWFRSQVQKAIDGIEDGSNRAIPEDEWAERSRLKRAELQRRIGLQGR